MAVTLRDVAQKAGVSVRTVSNVVNGFQHIAPATRARVQAALEELDYRPNLVARSLRQGRTGIIMLVLPEINVSYFGELAHEVVDYATSAGITVQIDESGGDPEREKQLITSLAQASWVDGVLFSSLGLRGVDLAGLSGTRPLVLLGERTARTTLDHVGIDNVEAARQAVAHLIERGRTRIAALGGSGGARDATSRYRLKGFQKAMQAAGLDPAGLYLRTPDYRRTSAAAAVRELLQWPERPDALFCFSDELAAGALRELHDQGVRVPRDMAVVGFDDIEASRFSVPALTSVRPDKAGIAKAAVDALLNRLDDPQGKPREIDVPFELVVRESSG
ncbi:LacI family transcriptional regulator [Kineosporia rhizophila]|uniref:LacI family DNA-binding transcriptional regulator n=1 Tax=Kineosporia TaxID=49184 RepID=UPI001E608408|nr:MULTISPECIES: LacI family DNA-binding transcriptional regulator [Kineosporia]MCE0534788.1 LacI family transcriptional regulator [Kineosporia rhizophila]GLY19285.1 LacI family transcriptional regulator [Kineosporia sp. NBRC 101677]